MAEKVSIHYVVTLPSTDLVEIIDKWIPDLRVALKQKIRPTVQGRFRRRIRNWELRVSFSSKYERRGRVVLGRIHIFPASPAIAVNIWRWISRGTKPHTIAAKRAPMLRYRKFYFPHTSPSGGYGLKSGGTYEGPRIRRDVVKHPGIEPRNFEEYIMDEIKEDTYDKLLDSFDKTLRTHYGRQKIIRGRS